MKHLVYWCKAPLSLHPTWRHPWSSTRISVALKNKTEDAELAWGGTQAFTTVGNRHPSYHPGQLYGCWAQMWPIAFRSLGQSCGTRGGRKNPWPRKWKKCWYPLELIEKGEKASSHHLRLASTKLSPPTVCFFRAWNYPEVLLWLLKYRC